MIKTVSKLLDGELAVFQDNKTDLWLGYRDGQNICDAYGKEAVFNLAELDPNTPVVVIGFRTTVTSLLAKEGIPT